MLRLLKKQKHYDIFSIDLSLKNWQQRQLLLYGLWWWQSRIWKRWSRSTFKHFTTFV